LSNEEKTNDYENFEKGMTYMKILKKGVGGVVEKRGDISTYTFTKMGAGMYLVSATPTKLLIEFL
jgi:hypothetical protein